MARIYLIRHGESIANTKGIYQGQTFDTGLSLLGKNQAVALAKTLAFENLDTIIASPLKRTLTTAQVLAKPHGIEVIKNINVVETNHGEWEGKNKDFIRKKWQRVYKTWLGNPAKAVFPNGESFLETQTRVLLWWEKLIVGRRNVALVSHDNILRIIIAEVLGLDLNKIWSFHLLPAAITIVEVVDGTPKLTLLNEAGHITNLKTDLSTHAL